MSDKLQVAAGIEKDRALAPYSDFRPRLRPVAHSSLPPSHVPSPRTFFNPSRVLADVPPQIRGWDICQHDKAHTEPPGSGIG